MKRLNFAIPLAVCGLTLAFSFEPLKLAINTSINKEGIEHRYIAQNQKHKNIDSLMSEAKEGVRETGHYNSNIITPPPPNLRPGLSGDLPTHTYGDTANRRDGLNSVR